MPDLGNLETPWESTIAAIAAEIAREERQRTRAVRLDARGLPGAMQWTNEARARGLAQSQITRSKQR